MHTTITGRRVNITEGIKQHIEEKLKRIERFALKIIEVHTVLTVEKDRHIAEITLVAKKLSISSKSETQDMYTSFDSALDLLEERIAKYLDKRKSLKIRLLKKKSEAIRAERKTTLKDIEISA